MPVALSSSYTQNSFKTTFLLLSTVVDLKKGNGEIYEGILKSGKADCTITVSDDNFMDLVAGKLDGQQVTWQCCYLICLFCRKCNLSGIM